MLRQDDSEITELHHCSLLIYHSNLTLTFDSMNGFFFHFISFLLSIAFIAPLYVARQHTFDSARTVILPETREDSSTNEL